MRQKKWTAADIPHQTNLRVLITGANSGIGFAAARELLRHGATVVLACRDRTRGEAALAKLRAGVQGGSGEAELVLLDLASLDSSRSRACFCRRSSCGGPRWRARRRAW